MIKDLIILTAPTASGKTNLVLELGKRFPIEAISADSRQIFKLLDIGTAKITNEENQLVKHHLIDIINPDEQYSAGKFESDSIKLIDEIISRNHIPIVIGGTGFYIKSLVEGIEDDNITDDKKLEIRTQLKTWIDNFGIDFIKNKLNELDPLAFKYYKGQNLRRLSRALEYFLLNNKSITTQVHFNKNNYNPNYFIIDTEREQLYSQINNRTIQMWELGFENEVLKLLELGYGIDNYSLNSVGYRECISYIKNDISKKEAITDMQKFTRHFAKRQLTWINNQIPIENSIKLEKNALFDNLCKECDKYFNLIS